MNKVFVASIGLQNHEMQSRGSGSSTPPGFSSNQSNPIVSPIVNTTYNLTITDDNGCTATDYTVVNVDNQPDATIDTVAPMCIHDYSIYLSAAAMGIGSYWSGNGIVDNISGLFDPSVAGVGTHTIFYTIVNGECSDSATTTIEVLPIPDITASNDGPVCEGFPVNFTSSSTFEIDEYQWFGPGGTLDTIPDFTIPNAQINHAGNYMVTVTDFNGCTNEAETTLEVYPNPIVNITPPNPAICNGEPIILSAQGQGQINGYEWSTGETTPTISVNQGNTSYSVTVVDEHGCTGADTIYVTESNIEIDLIYFTNTCENSNEGTISVLATGGSEPYTYEWTGPGNFSANTPTINNLYPGIYYLTVTDNSQCSETETYIVEELETPELEITDDIICTGTNDGELTVTVTNMDGPFTYLWSGGQDTETIINQPAGNYSVTVTAENSCSATISTYIDNYPVPEVNITPSESIICNMVPITLDAGDGGWSSYHWSTGDSIQIIEVHTPDADYSVTITDIHGCVGYDTIHIGGSNLAIKDSVVVHTCEGQNDGSVSQTIVGGDEPLVFEWEGPDDFTADTEDISNLFAGDYHFTVTDANGCLLEEVYIVEAFPIPLLEISTENACNNDNTGSAEVIVTNMPGPFSYNWSNGETDDEINNQFPGQYIVTVTDNTTGCSAEAVANIESFDVNADFVYHHECLNLTSIQNNGMYYVQTNGIPENWEEMEYYWDFGNGTINADPLAILDYEYEGFYCPSLTLTQENCSDTYQMQVYVFPTNCYCNFVEVDPDENEYYSYDIEIYAGTTEQWENRQVWITDNLIIEDGATLTLKQCTIHMGPKGRIIVEPKATLNSVASVFTSWELGPDCDHMWQGIEVHGQNPYSPNPYIGSVNFYGSPEEPSIVKNAHIAVLLGERNMDYTCQVESFTGALPFYIKGYDGKMVVGNQNVTFENNGIDVKMVQTMFYPYNNNSEITNCQFICNAPLLDLAYHIDHPDPYGFGFSPFGYPNQINPRNPWAGPANEYQRTVYGVWTHWQNVKAIKGCSFNNIEKAIESHDSRYIVADCSFLNHRIGIDIHNFMADMASNHEIVNNTFNLIPGDANEIGYHIRINGGLYDKIHDNTFGHLFTTTQGLNSIGIQTVAASKFFITENSFYYMDTAIQVIKSGIGGGEIRADLSSYHDDWQGNIFSNCQENILTQIDNPRLRLRCNMCNNNIPGTTPLNIRNEGILANQGYIPPSPPVTLQYKYGAGNEFDGSAANPRLTLSDNSYIYYHHTAPLSTIPLPIDFLTDPESVGVPKLTNSKSCPLLVPDIWVLPPGLDSQVFITLDSLYSEISMLTQEYSNLINDLDDGRTYELLNDIYGNVSQGRLKNKLIECSPLSDTVVKSLLIEYPLAHGNFKNVMILNLPVSKDVEPYFNERILTLPSGIANHLKPLQGLNPSVTTPTSLNRKIDEVSTEKQLYLNNLVFHLTDTINNRYEDAKFLLQRDASLSSKQDLLSYAINTGDYTTAYSLISDISGINSEIDDWLNLNEFLISLYSNNKSVYEMNLDEYNYVRDLAYKCPISLATVNARSILYLVSGEEVPECITMGTRNARQLVKEVEFASAGNEAYIEDNYPDPFTDKTYIDYYIPEGSEGSIFINDMYGRKLTEYKAFEGENILTVEKGNLAPGIYTYGLILNGQIIEFKKLVIKQ